MSRRKNRRIRKQRQILNQRLKDTTMPAETPTEAREHDVLLMKDTMLTFPEMYLEVYVATKYAWEEAMFAELFVRSKCSKATDPSKADLVVFVGGADVNPRYYGEEPYKTTSYDDKVDAADEELFEYCLANGIPMFGVCRGAQFLHVMNGGRLYQDIDGHHGDHSMYDRIDKRVVSRVSSVHHQACIDNPDGGMIVLADTYKSTIRHLNPTDSITRANVKGSYGADIEAFFYRDTHCLGVQGHPEYRGYHEFAQWTLSKIEQYIGNSPDVSLQDGFRRLKPEFLDERNARWADDPAEDPAFDDDLPLLLTQQ